MHVHSYQPKRTNFGDELDELTDSRSHKKNDFSAKNRLLFASLSLVVIVLAVGFLWVAISSFTSKTDDRQQAAAIPAVSIKFNPATLSVNVGQEFTVAIELNTGGKAIAVAEVLPTFDSSYFQAISLTSAVDMISITHQQKNASGKIKTRWVTELSKPDSTLTGGTIVGSLYKRPGSGRKAVHECYFQDWDDYILVTSDSAQRPANFCAGTTANWRETYTGVIGYVGSARDNYTMRPMQECFDETNLNHYYVTVDKGCQAYADTLTPKPVVKTSWVYGWVAPPESSAFLSTALLNATISGGGVTSLLVAKPISIPPTGATGQGTIALLKLKALKAGSSTLTFDRAKTRAPEFKGLPENIVGTYGTQVVTINAVTPPPAPPAPSCRFCGEICPPQKIPADAVCAAVVPPAGQTCVDDTTNGGCKMVAANPQQSACTGSGGIWKNMPDACVDRCSAVAAGTTCAAVVTLGCDCGVSKCTNDTGVCVANSAPAPPAAGSVSCDGACTTTTQCVSGLACVSGKCRLDANPTSTTCAAAPPAVGSVPCNGTCTATSQCVTGLSCTSGVCKNHDNPADVTCAPPPAAAANLRLEFRLQGLRKAGVQIPATVTIKYTATGSATVVKEYAKTYTSTTSGVLASTNALSLEGINLVNPIDNVEVFVKTPTSLKEKIGTVRLIRGTANLISPTALFVGDFNRDGDQNNLFNILDIAKMLTQYKALDNPLTDLNREFDVNFDNNYNSLDASLVIFNYQSLQLEGETP